MVSWSRISSGNHISLDCTLARFKTAFRVKCFNQIVDKEKQSLEPRLKHLKSINMYLDSCTNFRICGRTLLKMFNRFGSDFSSGQTATKNDRGKNQ